MSEYKDKIPAAGAIVEFLYDAATGSVSNRISGPGFRSMYLVAMSLDGRHLLDSVPPGGLGQVMVYPKSSVLAFMQSDEQGMWGRNCPYCQKYFRTDHIMGATYCPYCAQPAPDLAFITKEQRSYLTAFYDAGARAHLERKNTTLEMAEITDRSRLGTTRRKSSSIISLAKRISVVCKQMFSVNTAIAPAAVERMLASCFPRRSTRN